MNMSINQHCHYRCRSHILPAHQNDNDNNDHTCYMAIIIFILVVAKMTGIVMILIIMLVTSASSSFPLDAMNHSSSAPQVSPTQRGLGSTRRFLHAPNLHHLGIIWVNSLKMKLWLIVLHTMCPKSHVAISTGFWISRCESDLQMRAVHLSQESGFCNYQCESHAFDVFWTWMQCSGSSLDGKASLSRICGYRFRIS